MANGDPQRRRSGSPGATLPVVLLILATVGYGAGRAEISAQYLQQRERETEFLFRGAAYVRAIESFYLAETDPAKRRLPRSLEELERDPRSASARHIRRLYEDPLTKGPFKPLAGQGGGVVGVASASRQPLFQRVAFGPELPFVTGATKAGELRFEIDPKALDAKALQQTPTGRAPSGRSASPL